MARIILVAVMIFSITLTIQGLVAATLLRFLSPFVAWMASNSVFWGSIAVLVNTLMALLAAALAQIAVWALAFLLLGQFTDFGTAFYHSAVNFSSLGYGDIVMSGPSRLLGPLETVNGVLMLGVSVSILNATMQGLRRSRRGKP